MEQTVKSPLLMIIISKFIRIFQTLKNKTLKLWHIIASIADTSFRMSAS